MTHVYTYKLISNIIKKQKTKNKKQMGTQLRKHVQDTYLLHY